jgi:hypothetical protein
VRSPIAFHQNGGTSAGKRESLRPRKTHLLVWVVSNQHYQNSGIIRTMNIVRYAFLWFPLVIVAIVNGLIRQELIIPLTGDLAGHQVSTVTFVLLLFGYTWLVMRRWPIPASKQSWQIGAMWLVMTVVFEFGFGHYVMGHPWERLLHDYNLIEGRLWVVVLAATFVAPAVVRRWQGRKRDE